MVLGCLAAMTAVPSCLSSKSHDFLGSVLKHNGRPMFAGPLVPIPAAKAASPVLRSAGPRSCGRSFLRSRPQMKQKGRGTSVLAASTNSKDKTVRMYSRTDDRLFLVCCQ
jgi:hypothetical protein